VQADWVQRLTVRASGETIGVRGYSHFLVEDGLIRRHRSVVAPEVGLEPDTSSSIHADPGGEARSHRHYPDRPVVGVGAVILVTDDDRGAIGWSGPPCMPCGVVLIKRRFEPLAGQWSLPGGTLEVGETLEAGVAREIAEETGLAVEVGPVVEVFDRILFDEARRVRYHFVLIDYLCRPRAGPLQSGSDVSDVIVADPSRLGDYHLTAKAEGVIRRALQMRVPE
jgi:ADP-ribose pyrophosphatase YjhB (NUDIX family)